jgi:hypothetical protein
VKQHKKVKGETVAKAKRQLTVSEAFYVESHFGTKEPKALAKEMGVPVKLVSEYVAKLKQENIAPPEAPKPKTSVEKAQFAVGNGTVSMTKGASEKGDDAHKKPRNESLYNSRRLRNCTAAIDPSKPIL